MVALEEGWQRMAKVIAIHLIATFVAIHPAVVGTF